MIYKLGTSVQISASFYDEDGVAFDPDVVTAMVRSPAGAETSYVYGTDAAVAKDGTGRYHMWVATDAAGTFAYRWKGIDTDSEAVRVANESTFDVDESEFATP